jgi:serine/threonine-protein kinase
MALTRGTRLEHYEILGLVGAGGMGEVHRARDTKLNRDVAIKVLSSSVASDPDRLARFHREAQVLAALNHPNIAQIHGVVEAPVTVAGDTPSPALVMEFVEGPTLADRLATGPMSLDEALRIANQIADAVEAAHERGIVHRDLKPANIIVRDDETVKVLDFGLAKAVDSAASDVDAAQSPTISMRATQQGLILGTAAYMAPEQARGRRVDHRADIWAFGCVLFEMLAGRRAFDAADVTDTIVAVLSKEPDWHQFPASAAALRPLLTRCLKKDPRQRLQAIGDARIEIEELSAGSLDQPAGRPTSSAPLTTVAVAAAAIAGAAIAGGAVAWTLGRADAAPPVIARLEILPPVSRPLTVQSADRNLAISPDGRYVVYRSGNPSQLVLRPLDSMESHVIAGTSGARAPFFSPDGRWIAFFDGSWLKKVALAGGPVLTICESDIPRGASWGDDGHIVFATQRSMLRVAEEGGKPVELSKPDLGAGERGHWHLSVLPGGQHILFTIVPADPAATPHVAVLDRASGRIKRLVPGSQPEYLKTGHVVFAAAGRLWAARFNASRLEIVGEPTPIVAGVRAGPGAVANYATSRTGSLVYIPPPAAIGTQSLVWIDRQGRETSVDAPPRAYQSARLSPDGSRAAVIVLDRELHNVGILDLKTGTLLTLASESDNDRAVWSADGRRIVFASQRGGTGWNLWAQAADGTGQVDRLSISPYVQLPAWVPRDGSGVLGTDISPVTNGDIVWFPKNLKNTATQSGTTATDLSALDRLIATKGIDYNPDVSPDGRFIAYQSNTSGRQEILVQPFPDVNRGQWRASEEGGTHPAWAGNGRELFYQDLSNVLTAVTVQVSGGRPTFGRPVKLFKVYSGEYDARLYDPASDGRFLVVKNGATEDNRSDVVVVVLNWFEELKPRLAVQ